ncbi:hypothetical protein [Roseateles sp.]|uniref:hypothetical protein n=1 Tax=Roseateles sp. TaxID=1971397 RepID=UPI0031D3ABC4
MKQELKDIAVEVATKTAPAGGLLAWSTDWLSQINWNVFLGAVLIVLQILYLLRKWWREETSFGVWMRRKVGAPVVSKPMELDE